MKLFPVALFAYIIGSIPTGYILFRWTEKKDIRSFGSQSIGATNVLRTKGLAPALLVLLLDMAKGTGAAFLARAFIPDLSLALVASFFAVLGHCFPFTIGFRGGKGVATSVGVMAVFAWKPLLLSAGVFFLVVLLTRIVSLGSLLASLSVVLLVYVFTGNPWFTAAAGLFPALIWIRHRSNIQRLLQGKENRLGKKIEIRKKEA